MPPIVAETSRVQAALAMGWAVLEALPRATKSARLAMVAADILRTRAPRSFQATGLTPPPLIGWGKDRRFEVLDGWMRSISRIRGCQLARVDEPRRRRPRGFKMVVVVAENDHGSHWSAYIETPKGAIAQLGERLLCKQEVAGSIPAGSIRRIPAIKRDSTRKATRRRLRQVPDGSVLEASRPARTDPCRSGRLACRRQTAAPSAGGGAAGLTSHRTQKRRRDTSRSPTSRRRRSQS